jgi:tetratricopeptide (TPR) repeat protein
MGDLLGVPAGVNVSRIIFFAIPLLAVTSALITFGLFMLFGLLFRRRVLRRVRDVERSIWNGDLDDARRKTEQWERGVRRKNAYDRVNIAWAWSRIGDHDRALSTLDGTTTPKGRASRAVRRQADELRYEGLRATERQAEAGWFLNDVVDRDPRAPWLVGARVSSARASGERSHLEAAVEQARSVATADPKNIQAAWAVLRVATEQNRFAEGAEMLEQIVRQTERNARKNRMGHPPGFYHLLVALGTLHVASGSEERAEDAFGTALSRAPDQQAAAQEIVRARAGALFSARRFAEAATAYEGILAEAPDARLFLALAECRHREGDPEAASDALARARDLDPEIQGGRLLEARLLSDAGDVRQAERIALEEAGDEDTTDPLSLYTIAYIRATGHLAGAEATLRRYVDLQPHDQDLGPLLDKPAPGGGSWRERLEVARRPDV